jgi:hypothetical protein
MENLKSTSNWILFSMTKEHANLAMYFNPPSDTASITSTSNYRKQIFIAAVLIILLGLMPRLVLDLI